MNHLSSFRFRIVLTISFITISLFARSQDVVYAYGAAFSGNGSTSSSGIAVDANGNTYTVGFYSGTIDFDPGPDSVNLTSGSRSAFVCKLDAAGHYVWVKQLGAGAYASGIVIDANGNLVIGGGYGGANDVWKLDTAGTILWVKQIAIGSLGVNAITVDAAGNIYLTGQMQGRDNLFAAPHYTSLTSAGANDVYVQKLDRNGNGLWAKSMGGPSEDISYGIAVDAAGSVYTTGWLIGSGDYDPGPGVVTISGGVFLSKLDSTGTYVWAKALQANYGMYLAADTMGHIYMAGQFASATYFGPGPGAVTLSRTTSSGYDVFVSKLDTAGSFLWTKQFSGTVTGEWVQRIALDPAGDVYSTGYFFNTVDFDPGPGVANLTATNTTNPDVYVSKLDANGNYVYAKRLGGPLREEGWGITADAAGNVYTTGYFRDSIDLDPGPGTALVTSPGQGVFVSRLMPVTQAPLPLSWLKVSGHLNNQQQAVINWTVQETNVQQYTVEKSTDGKAFNPIGMVAARGDGQHDYTYTEPVALQKNAWYRIRQTDIDRHAGYSTLVQLMANGDARSVTVYPVPARESFIIQTNNNNLLHTKAVLIDISGRLVKLVAINDYTTQVNTGGLQQGMYVLQLADGSSMKIILQQ